MKVSLSSFGLFLALLLCASVDGQFTPTFSEGDCVIPVPAGETQGETFICGTVNVPEFHENPDGENVIELAVAVIKGKGDSNSNDSPLVVFNGGPGSSIFTLTNSLLHSPVRDDRDIVLFSERGTFGSKPFLSCPEIGKSMVGHFGESMDNINKLQLSGFTACHDRFVNNEGINLNAYNNDGRVGDLPVVMAALGYESYNLWGVSGGAIYTQYALREYLNDVPGIGIRTIMTDSGAFPQVSFEEVWTTLLDNVSNSFRLLFEDCAASTTCNEHYPNLETVFFTLVDDLNNNPVTLSIVHPVTGEEGDYELVGDTVVTMLANSFSNVARMPKTIYAMSKHGDFSAMQALIPSIYLDAGADYSDGLFQSVACPQIGHLTVDDVSTEVAIPQIIQAMLPSIQQTFDICNEWNVDRVPIGDVLVSDTVPILIMEGLYDANKPPELGKVVAENFSTSHLVEFPSKAHVVFGGCALEMMAEFMNTPTNLLIVLVFNKKFSLCWTVMTKTLRCQK